MRLHLTRFSSPLGPLVVIQHPTGVLLLTWEEYLPQGLKALNKRHPGYTLVEDSDPFDVRGRLDAWFQGCLNAFADLPLDPGGTVFQRRVWSELCRIPPGKVRSYGEVAASLSKPRAARAVGAANRANPIAIVIPCHRVIAADGTLGGYIGEYARPGKTTEALERKIWLLRHEGVHLVQGRVVRQDKTDP